MASVQYRLKCRGGYCASQNPSPHLGKQSGCYRHFCRWEKWAPEDLITCPISDNGRALINFLSSKFSSKLPTPWPIRRKPLIESPPFVAAWAFSVKCKATICKTVLDIFWNNSQSLNNPCIVINYLFTVLLKWFFQGKGGSGTAFKKIKVKKAQSQEESLRSQCPAPLQTNFFKLTLKKTASGKITFLNVGVCLPSDPVRMWPCSSEPAQVQKVLWIQDTFAGCRGWN